MDVTLGAVHNRPAQMRSYQSNLTISYLRVGELIWRFQTGSAVRLTGAEHATIKAT